MHFYLTGKCKLKPQLIPLPSIRMAKMKTKNKTGQAQIRLCSNLNSYTRGRYIGTATLESYLAVPTKAEHIYIYDLAISFLVIFPTEKHICSQETCTKQQYSK